MVKHDARHYTALYEKLPLVRFSLDHDHLVTAVNAYGCQELAYHENELVGKRVLTMIHAGDREAARTHLAAAAIEDSLPSWEFRLIKKDGSAMWVDAFARSAPAVDHRPEILVLCKDVTQRKLAEHKVLAYQEQLKTLTVESLLDEERERRRIAMGLHDDVGQNLAMALAHLDGLEDSDPGAETDRCVEAIRGLLHATIQATRSLTFELSSPVLYELGLERALRGLADKVGKQHGIHIRFETDSQPRPISDDTSILLYRTVRELLRNIEKHAHARSASIRMATFEGEAQVRVEDDGVGMNGSRDSIRPTKGFGLFSIREHVRSIGGRMEIDSGAGNGTRVVVTVPIEIQAGN